MGLALKSTTARQPHEPRILAFLGDDITRETVSRLLGQLGWRHAEIGEGGIAAAAQALEGSAPPSLLIIDISDNHDPLAAMDQLAEICPPETRVVAIGSSNDIMLYRRLLSMGVTDYFPKPVAAEALHDALLQASRPVEKPAAAPVAKAAQLIAVIGARGGVGTTTLAAALGWCLSEEQGKRVALLDLDLQFGNLALALDLEPGRGLREALENPERIDSLLIAGAMSGTSERLRVLAAEEPLEDHPHLDPSSVDPLLAALHEGFDVVIADVPRALDSMGRRLLSRANSIIIVTDLSLAGMRDTHRLAGLLDVLQPQTKPQVIVSRAGMLGAGEVGQAEFEKGIGRKIAATIPHDVKAAIAMAQQGKALPAAAKTSKATMEIRRLAESLSGEAKKAAIPFYKRLLAKA